MLFATGATVKVSPPLALPDNPIPSTRELAKYCYPNYLDIIKKIEKLFKKKFKNLEKYKDDVPLDQPNKDFMGPF